MVKGICEECGSELLADGTCPNCGFTPEKEKEVEEVSLDGEEQNFRE